MMETLKGFADRTLSGFAHDFELCPRVLAMLEPWAGIGERLRRIHPISNLRTNNHHLLLTTYMSRHILLLIINRRRCNG